MLNIGIIGAGRIGRLHAQTVARSLPRTRLIAISDVHLPAAQELANTLNVAHAYADHQQLLEHPDIDAVIIASSTDTHAPFIIDAARAGKHIFCEKPIDFSIARIDEALAEVEKAGVSLQIGFNRRFDPSFARIRQAIAEGEIGQPHLLHIISRDPAPPPVEYIKVSGGMFFDMTIHDFDMARFLFGDVDEIYAVGANLVDPAIRDAGDIDTAMITLKFKNGAIGMIDNSRKAVYGYDQRVEAFGSKGSARNNNLYADEVVVSDKDHVRRGLPLNFFMDRYVPSYIAELQAFVEAILSGEKPPVSGRDGRIPVIMAMAALRSYHENRPVRLNEIDPAQ